MIENLDRYFQELFSDMLSEFDERGDVTLKKVVCAIIHLPHKHKKEFESYLKDNLSLLMEAKSIEHLFYILNINLRFTDYRLIERLIKLGSESLKLKFSKYMKHLQRFLQETTVMHIIHSKQWSGDFKQNPPDGFMKLKVKIMKDSHSCSLERVDQLRRSMCDQLRLAEVILYLNGAEEDGSFLVSWIFPAVLEEKVIEAVNAVNTCFVLREQIFLIMVGDRIFEPQDDNCGTMVRFI